MESIIEHAVSAFLDMARAEQAAAERLRAKHEARLAAERAEMLTLAREYAGALLGQAAAEAAWRVPDYPTGVATAVIEGLRCTVTATRLEGQDAETAADQDRPAPIETAQLEVTVLGVHGWVGEVVHKLKPLGRHEETYVASDRPMVLRLLGELPEALSLYWLALPGAALLLGAWRLTARTGRHVIWIEQRHARHGVDNLAVCSRCGPLREQFFGSWEESTAAAAAHRDATGGRVLPHARVMN